MNKNLKDRADRLMQSIYLDGYEHGFKEGLDIADRNYKAVIDIKAEIEECLKVLEEKDKISPKPIYSKSEDMERIETYKQCLRFINKHIGDTE